MKNDMKPRLAKNVIGVASGKGGVGKSTTAVNLAATCVAKGAKVGLLDADIHGPSIPIMIGTEQSQSPELNDAKTMMPVESHGIKTMSIGYLVHRDRAVVWRGPMLIKALKQLIYGTDWGSDLDYLFIDFPPGTGDVHISIQNMLDLTGIVMVTTPQKVAICDVSKSCDAFIIMGGNIIGIIENMSLFSTESGNAYIFGRENTEHFAKSTALDVLGKVPILEEISIKADTGTLPVLSSKVLDIYAPIMDTINSKLNIKS